MDYLITENFNLRVAAVEDGRPISGVIVGVDLQMKRKTLPNIQFAYLIAEFPSSLNWIRFPIEWNGMLNGFRRWGEIDYNGIIPWGVNSSGGNKKKEETHTHRERERERKKITCHLKRHSM